MTEVEGMHDDVSAEDGRNEDADGDEVGQDGPGTFPDGTGEPPQHADEAPGSSSALDHTAERVAADLHRYAGPLLDQIQPLLPLIESASRLARQAQVAESFGAEVARMARSLDEVTRGLRVPVRSPAESAMTNLIAANLRGIDQLTAVSARSAAYATTARWAEQMLGSGALTAWRVSLDASARAETLYRSLASSAAIYAPYPDELLRISHSLTGLTDWIVQQDATSRLVGELSARPLARWRDFVTGLTVESAPYQVRASVLSGYTTLGILSGDVLTSSAEDTAVAEAGASRVEADVLPPWEQSRLQLARDLRDCLGRFDAGIPGLLDGAWDELRRNGPAAAEKAAHCIVEVLDRTLRAAAPDEAVREWHASTGRAATEWEGQRRPPHSLRVRYLAHRLGGERAMVVTEYESLVQLRTRLRERLEAVKHASQGDLLTVRILLLGTEDLLMMLLLPRS